MNTLYCIGDSLTFGAGVRVSEKWVTLAGAVNLGVPGDTTAGMLARLQKLLPEAKGKTVLLLGGSNDIFFTGSDLCARNNMAAMVHQLLSAGCRVLVGLPLPIDAAAAPQKWASLADFPKANEVLQAYRRWLVTFCAAFDVPVVDFAQDYVNHPDLYLDGLHPNAEGHRLMAARLLEALK
jgi:lysophospholipase L1-like esterase